MATIYNNPMPMSGALFVTNPQGKFYKWLGRHYKIERGKLKKRSSALSDTSKQGRKFGMKSEWGRYQKLYDSLPATATQRKSIITAYGRSKRSRMKDDSAQREAMVHIFEESDWSPSQSKSRKRRKSKSSSMSAKRAGSRRKHTMARRKTRSAARKRKTTKKLSAYNRFVKAQHAKAKRAGIQISMDTIGDMWQKKKAGKKWTHLLKGKKRPAAKRRKPAKRRTAAKRATKRGGSKRRRTSKVYGHSHTVRRNARVYSKPKLKKLVYPDNKIGKKLNQIVKSAEKYLPSNATDSEIRAYVKSAGAPAGLGASLVNDIRAAIDASGVHKKGGITKRTAAGDWIPLHSYAREAVKKLGRLPIEFSGGQVVKKEVGPDGKMHWNKAWKKLSDYVKRTGLRPAAQQYLQGILEAYYGSADKSVTFLTELVDEGKFKKKHGKSAPRGRKRSLKRKKTSRAKRSVSRAGAGKSAFAKAGLTLRKLGYKPSLRGKSVDTLAKRRAKIRSLKAKLNPRRNPQHTGGVMGMVDGIKPLERGLRLMDTAEHMVEKVGHMITDVPVVGRPVGGAVLAAAPYTKPMLLGGTAVGLNAMTMKYVTPKALEIGKDLLAFAEDLPLVGEAVEWAADMSAPILEPIGYTLNGGFLAVLAHLGARYGLFDQQSANIIGAAAVVSGAAVDMMDYLRGQNELSGLAEMGALAMNGAHYGDGGQYFLGGLGVAGAPSEGDYHYAVGAEGAVGPFYPQLRTAGSFEGFGASIPCEAFYAHCKPADAAACPHDLDPDELQAALRSPKGGYPKAFPALPHQVINNNGKLSKSAGKKGHKWGWLHKMIGEDNVKKLSALPTAKRQELIVLMKEKALDEASASPLAPSARPLVEQARAAIKPAAARIRAKKGAAAGRGRKGRKSRRKSGKESIIQKILPSRKESLIQDIGPASAEPLFSKGKRLRRGFDHARKPSSEALLQRTSPLPVGNFSAVEMGALAMNGFGAMGGLAELSGVTGDLAGATNTAGGVDTFGSYGALLYAGAL